MYNKTKKTPATKQFHGYRIHDDGDDHARVTMKMEDLDRIKYKWKCDKKEMELRRNRRKHHHFLKEDSSSDGEDPLLVKKPKLAEHKRNFVASWLQGITLSPTPSESTLTMSTGNNMQETGKSLTSTSTTTYTSSSGSGSISSSSTKKVTFVFARNKEHDYNDYWNSVKTYPRLPYDTKKRPSCGLLKRDKEIQSSGRHGDDDLS